MRTLSLAALPIVAFAAALALPALAQDEPAEPEATTATEEATADAATSVGGTGALVNAEGASLGNASVSLTASGHAVVLINAEGIPEGIHGVHLHMVGACEGPAFESAGEHITLERQHGVQAEEGPHEGDLPNAHVGADGMLAYDGVAMGLTEELLYDEDGSALMVHANEDDYTSQPGGASGDRIACAVIERAAE